MKNFKIINGYKYIHVPDHSCSEFVLEHRYIYEKHFGKIPKNNIIHHINGNKVDNKIENLISLTIDEHAKWHRKNTPNLFKHLNKICNHYFPRDSKEIATGERKEPFIKLNVKVPKFFTRKNRF